VRGRRSWLRRFKSRDERLHVAAINDNGGRWYLCRSPLSAASLHLALEEPDTSLVLLNSIGGILGCPTVHRKTGRIWVQIYVPDDLKPWQITAALEDFEVFIVAGRHDVPERDK